MIEMISTLLEMLILVGGAIVLLTLVVHSVVSIRVERGAGGGG